MNGTYTGYIGEENYVKIYTYNICGFGVYKRNPKDSTDKTLCFRILSEDDGCYFESKDQSWSTYWVKSISEAFKDFEKRLKKDFKVNKFGEYLWE